MDWSRFNKKPIRLGVHTGGARLREHRNPIRMQEAESSAATTEEEKCKTVRARVAELQAKSPTANEATTEPTTQAVSEPVIASETPPAAVLKKTVAAQADGYEAAPAPSILTEAPKTVVTPPATGSQAIKALSNLEMQIEKGAAVKAVEQYKGLTKSQRKAKRAKEEKEASKAAVGQLLVSYEKTLKDKGTITPENLAEHILVRNVHKRRENWYREQADRNWYRDYVKRSDYKHFDDQSYLDRKGDEAAADRKYAESTSDRYRSERYDASRASYEYDTWKREMDRRLDDADYWRNHGYRD